MSGPHRSAVTAPVRLLTKAELAQLLGVSLPAIDAWVRRGCPVAQAATGAGRGNGARFALPDVLDWRLARGAGGDAARELRHRLLRADTEDAELALAVKRGELRTVEAWTEAVAAGFQRAGANLRSLPPRAAAAAVGVSSLEQGLARMTPLVEQVIAALYAGDGEPDAEVAPPDGFPRA